MEGCHYPHLFLDGKALLIVQEVAAQRAESPPCDSLGWSERGERRPRVSMPNSLRRPEGPTLFTAWDSPRNRSRPYRAVGLFDGSHLGLRALRFTPGCHIGGFQPREGTQVVRQTGTGPATVTRRTDSTTQKMRVMTRVERERHPRLFSVTVPP